ncbi:hypothetical protein [Acinetobacter silvestris]|nr:hypothetical protein [Acinetobacter silvestris]
MDIMTAIVFMIMVVMIAVIPEIGIIMTIKLAQTMEEVTIHQMAVETTQAETKAVQVVEMVILVEMKVIQAEMETIQVEMEAIQVAERVALAEMKVILVEHIQDNIKFVKKGSIRAFF